MLGKLLKYEFKATGRMLIPLYAVLIVFAFINKLFLNSSFFGDSMGLLGRLSVTISFIVYIATMVAIFVVTLIIIIQRFYKNLLGDEGYLMNTLPVSALKNVFSKMIVAIAWNIVSYIVAGISIVIMAYKKGMFSSFFHYLGEFCELGSGEFGINFYLIIFEFILFIIISMILSVVSIYAALSIGHLAKNRRILASFGAFIGLELIMYIILSCIGDPIVNIFEGASASFEVMGVFFVMILILGIFSAACIFICNYVLKNKLNLE